ncbi:ComEA family DNA-binding protein [Yersinia pekkanenii]|uniref:Competence protein ComEA n=1 Tax=Yersinia pekkanenii TaxID=1288385 RepID=A0A0T9NJP3_9GAMM|nr:ComEA family DNA-binding protein [Yersinia pekkanenii]CNH15407.1 competence protein ComEA [Yersinia pekkanenii]CRY65579.1 competence protein ComEA [Yersinia pekkanenii]
MKFIGKLLVITALLAGFNLQQIANAAPASLTNSSQSGKDTAKGNVTTRSHLQAGNSKAKVPEAKSESANAATAAIAGNPSSQININSADAEQLAQFLSGIGRKKAEAIVNYREQFGPFTDAEQLLEVPGIGPSFLERNNARLKM